MATFYMVPKATTVCSKSTVCGDLLRQLSLCRRMCKGGLLGTFPLFKPRRHHHCSCHHVGYAMSALNCRPCWIGAGVGSCSCDPFPSLCNTNCLFFFKPPFHHSKTVWENTECTPYFSNLSAFLWRNQEIRNRPHSNDMNINNKTSYFIIFPKGKKYGAKELFPPFPSMASAQERKITIQGVSYSNITYINNVFESHCKKKTIVM